MLLLKQPGASERVFGPETAAAVRHSLHQFAQPLTVLQGVIEMALTETLDTANHLKLLSQAAKELGRLMDRYRQTCDLLHNGNHSSAAEISSSLLPHSSSNNDGALQEIQIQSDSMPESSGPALQVLALLPTVWLNSAISTTEDTRAPHV